MKKRASIFNGQAFFSSIASVTILFFLACMITSPAKFINSALNGVSVWAVNVLPSLLPFMFFTRLLSSLDFMPKASRPFAPLARKLFKAPPSSIYVFLMAILSGYPVGSKMVADQYMQGQISKNDAFKMLSFCSTSGPMFIVGAVGIGMFANAKIGYILLLSHILGAVLNGIYFRNLRIKDEKEPLTNKAEQGAFDIGEIVLNSSLAVLSVGCIITIFFIIIECISPIFALLPDSISAFLQGLVEITKGCLELSKISPNFTAVTLASFVISFGGFSTILQSISLISKVKMPVKLFIFQKFCHAIFSCLFTVTFLLIF